MASVNRVTLIGGVTRVSEIRFMPNGEAVANFSIATNETWKDKQGVKQEKTEYHNLVAYRKLAEIIGEYLTTGSQVYIEGKLQTRSWEKDGIKRYTTEIVADTMQMVGGGKKNGYGDDSAQSKSQSSTHKMGESKDSGSFDDFDDDIPFMNPYKFNWRVI